MLVFIDDSGDPGFKVEKGSSPIFVLAFVVFEDELEAEKTSLAIKELRRKLRVSDLFEFKFNKTNIYFKTKFFNSVKQFSFKVRAIVVKKEIIHSGNLITHKENFYNYFIMQSLRNSGGSIKNAKLRFDRRGEKLLRNELRVYLSRELDNKNSKIFSDLKFVDSRQNTLVQLADMAAGAINAYYSKNENKFLKMLKSTKKIEDLWEFK